MEDIAVTKQDTRKKKRKSHNGRVGRAGNRFYKTKSKGPISGVKNPFRKTVRSQFQKRKRKRKNSIESEGSKRKKVETSTIATSATVDTASPGQQGEDGEAEVEMSKVDTSTVVDTASPGQERKEGEAEDAAESIDSKCIVDGPSDIANGVTDWPQVQSVVLKENHFISTLISWFTADTTEQDKHLLEAEREELKKEEETKALREKYRSMLEECKSKRKIKDVKARREEKKLRNKMSVAHRRNVAKVNRKDQAMKLLTKQNGNQKQKGKTEADIYKEKHLMKQDRSQEKALELLNKTQNKRKMRKPVYNSEGELVFNKFDFSCNVTEENPYKKSKDLKNLFKSAMKEKEKIERMDKQGKTNTAAKLAEHRSWAAAMQRAEGVKVRDDIGLLKKSIKKKQQKKKSSQKKWELYKQTIEKKKQDKEAKRKKNIAARRDAKKNKRIKKAQKKKH